MSNIQITENASGKYSPEWFYSESQTPEWISFAHKADELRENFINLFGIERLKSLSGMFDSVNQQVADISVQVGQTPQGWNGSIFSMIENLSNSIMVPIAGVILAIVMTVDLIQMIADKNNLHDVDTWMIFKWVFKSAAAILIVTNTWNIVMGVFDMAQSVVAQAAGIINSDASIDISSVMTDLEPRLMEMDLGPLFGLWFQCLFIGITMWARMWSRRRSPASLKTAS